MNWHEVPSLAALRAFEALASHGTMTAAASSLNVTHAAIAQHVRSLEAHLGVQLTRKSGRGLVLTPEGTELATSLSDGFGLIHAGVRKLTDAQDTRPLNITATPSFAENWLMPRLGQFWAVHPDIMLSITPSIAVADMRREPFDLAIRYGAGDWKDVESTFLVDADYLVVATPSLLEGRQTNNITDLQDLPWLFESVHQEPRRWANENGLDFACCQQKELQTLNMLLSALRAGVGVSVVSRALVEKDIADGTLVQITAIPSDGMGYHIVTRQDALSKRTQIFKKWLLAAV